MDSDGLPIVGPGINLAEVFSLRNFTVFHSLSVNAYEYYKILHSVRMS